MVHQVYQVYARRVYFVLFNFNSGFHTLVSLDSFQVYHAYQVHPNIFFYVLNINLNSGLQSLLGLHQQSLFCTSKLNCLLELSTSVYLVGFQVYQVYQVQASRVYFVLHILIVFKVSQLKQCQLALRFTKFTRFTTLIYIIGIPWIFCYLNVGQFYQLSLN